MPTGLISQKNICQKYSKMEKKQRTGWEDALVMLPPVCLGPLKRFHTEHGQRNCHIVPVSRCSSCPPWPVGQGHHSRVCTSQDAVTPGGHQPWGALPERASQVWGTGPDNPPWAGPPVPCEHGHTPVLVTAGPQRQARGSRALLWSWASLHQAAGPLAQPTHILLSLVSLPSLLLQPLPVCVKPRVLPVPLIPQPGARAPQPPAEEVVVCRGLHSSGCLEGSWHVGRQGRPSETGVLAAHGLFLQGCVPAAEGALP